MKGCWLPDREMGRERGRLGGSVMEKGMDEVYFAGEMSLLGAKCEVLRCYVGTARETDEEGKGGKEERNRKGKSGSIK